MKTTVKIAVIAIMGMSLGINAQENKIGNTGNVGIGILIPEHKLHVKNDTGDSFTLIDASVNSGIRFLNGVNSFIEKRSGSGSLTINNQVSQGRLQFGTENITRMTILPNGDVGIGTTSPATKLHVKGVSQIEHSNGRSIRFDGYEGITTYGPSHWLHLNRYSNDNVAIGHNSIANVFMVKGGGNVGIGTISPTAKLSVNGKIHTKEVRVDLNLFDWADFVFKENYNLPTLKEVENHIKEKGHLIDIPSAKEVEKNGIYLGKMNAKLLQKIEELTLYTIAQEKKLKTQRESFEQQQEEINAQKKEIEELKKQNSRIKDLEKLVQKLLKDKN